jgi:uncharacterized membrane protein
MLGSKITSIGWRGLMSEHSLQHGHGYMERGTEFDRFVLFTDAVYAIAATLLIVAVEAPRLPSEMRDLSPMLRALEEVTPELFSFALGFWLITRFWLANHRFVARLGGIDRRFMGLTLVYLGFIAFLPFPTAFLGDNGPNPISVAFFALAIVVIATLEVVQLVYAHRAGLLREAVSSALFRWEVTASLVPAAVFLASIPIAFINPPLAMYFWLLTIPVGIVVSRRRPQRTPGP